MNLLIEYQYFGCVESFLALFKAERLILEQHETFQKMSFRSRCQILGSGKVIDLSVPLVGGRDQKALTRDIFIDNSQKWQIRHWRTLESCYNKSAFFEHYGQGVRDILCAGHEKLQDLDEATLRWALGKLKWLGKIEYSTTYLKTLTSEILDSRNAFLPANRASFAHKPYQQVFGSTFISNLSILDLLFNTGPQAGLYLNTMAKNA